jgi:RHS repeat-associated protein
VNGGTPVVWSIFRDNLGTITHLKNGTTIQEYSFDAYGRRRDKDDWSYTLTGEPALFADRGFTGHEHLAQFGLINMNGRLYDPIVGRFLSPDNYVQDPGSTQSFNRYGYCLNNPLRYTDPEGDTPINLAAAGIGAVIGGVINLSLNWNNCDGFWEYAAAFGVGAVGGAASGALLGTDGGASFWAVVGVGAASGALTSGTNDIIAQTTNNFQGNVNWNHVGQMSASGFVAGGLSSMVGYSIGSSPLINGAIKSPMLRSLIASPVTSGVGHWAGGTTYGMLNGQSFGQASNNAFDGIGNSMVVGTAIGLGATYISSKANGINPWTGKALTSISSYDYSPDPNGDNITMYRGTTGSEGKGGPLFMTDNPNYAATYVKNGGSVVEVTISRSTYLKMYYNGHIQPMQGFHNGSYGFEYRIDPSIVGSFLKIFK